MSQCAQQILTIVQDHEPPELRAALRFSRQTERPIHGAWVAVVVPVSPEVAGIGLGRLVLVDDCGHVIDPCWWTGRAGGGIAQAIGAALLEQIVVSAHVNCCRGVCSTMRFALVQRRWQSRCGWPPGGDCNAVVDALRDDSTIAGGRSPGNERLTPQTLEWRVTPGPSVKRGDTALFISCANCPRPLSVRPGARVDVDDARNITSALDVATGHQSRLSEGNAIFDQRQLQLPTSDQLLSGVTVAT